VRVDRLAVIVAHGGGISVMAIIRRRRSLELWRRHYAVLAAHIRRLSIRGKLSWPFGVSINFDITGRSL
jgi:hypothetical protein